MAAKDKAASRFLGYLDEAGTDDLVCPRQCGSRVGGGGVARADFLPLRHRRAAGCRRTGTWGGPLRRSGGCWP